MQTTDIQVTGDKVRTALYERIKKFEDEHEICLKTLHGLIEGEMATERAIAIMVSLFNTTPGKHLTGKSLVVKAWLDRISFIDREIFELSVIRAAINPTGQYLLTVNEALRYGMV